MRTLPRPPRMCRVWLAVPLSSLNGAEADQGRELLAGALA